ncbi:MAG: insulinase family protein, partial [Bacteroidota bacterium]
DEQRGVVQNEKRQGENEPYAVTEELIIKATYPSGHPYSWSVIGSMEDLNAASLNDVKDWFRTYYGSANAVLVVAGDIETNTAVEKVKKYFGDIPSGPPIAKFDSWVAKRTGSTRQQVQDRVPQARVYKVWNVPERGTVAADQLTLVANLLASGKTSRLYKRLVYDDQTATNVQSFVDLREIGSQFYIIATAKPGGDLASVEKAVDEELARFLKSGPTGKELQRVKTQYEAGFIRGIERIGGFGGKSDILAQNEVYGGSPDAYKKTLQHVSEATASELLGTAKDWLSDGVYELEVHPFPQFKTAAADTMLRKSTPPVGTPPEARFPSLERSTLSNGMKLVLAERPSIPVVNFNLLFDAGYAADQFATPGTANLAMNMMDEGTKTRNALQISEELAQLGANLNTGSNLDMSSVSLSALKSNLDASLNIFADVVLNPSFPDDDFKRLQKQTIAQIQREKATPIQMGLRVFAKFLYGPNHAYGSPLTGSGTESTVGAMKREDLIKFHQTWIKPNNATLVVVGATTMAEIKPKLEALFKGWKSGEMPKKNISAVALSQKPVVYLMDKPGALQSIIFAGHVASPKNNPHEPAIEAMNNILGGMFTSRINMNLREDKHWSYGSGSFLWGARAQRPFIAYAPVQTDKTKESMVEMSKELQGILNTKPATADELAKVQSSMTLELPGSWETNNAVGGSIGDLVRYGLPDDYYATYPKTIRSLSLSDISGAAKEIVHPDALVWVVVGDRSKIEAGVKDLNYGELHFIDGDGNVIQ